MLGWALGLAPWSSSAQASDSGLAQLASSMQRVQRARGQARLQASRDALAALDQTPELTQQSAAARYARSRLLDELMRSDEALAALPDDASLASLPARIANDVRLRRADHLAQLGRCDEALASLTALEDIIGSQAVARSRARCMTSSKDGGLASAAGAAAAPMTPEQKLRRVEKLTDDGRAEEALRELSAIKLPKSLKARGLHVRGMALFRSRIRYAEAARVLSAAAALATATAEDDAFFAARALARDDQDKRAIKAYRAFAQRYRTSKQAGEALYLAAWLELRSTSNTPAQELSAAKALATWLETPHAKTHPDLAAEAQFELAMHALLRGDATQAGERFGRYAAMTQGCLERGRGFYWGAQAYAASQRKPQAVELYNEAVRIEPLCYYALLSRAKLRALGEAVPEPYGALDPSAAGSADETTPIAVALPSDVAFYASIGLLDDAVDALRSQESALQAAAPLGRGPQALVHAYHSLGEHSRARAIVQNLPAGLLTSPPSSANSWAFAAAYARPYPDDVAMLAQTEQLDADLIYAIMLKESAFNPEVVSNADAIGLMQLLPKTAKSVEGTAPLGVPITRETLFDPHVNLTLGARLLHQLMARYQNQAPLAIAAYNAGSHRVDAWLARESRGLLARHSKDPIALDLFVEQIPIDQTRNYVRRVLAFMARYRYLRDGVVLEVPETLAISAAMSKPGPP